MTVKMIGQENEMAGDGSDKRMGWQENELAGE